jgi:peptidoglycan/xylan/chitin deacetylase (PgdA/CDA1 family)
VVLAVLAVLAVVAAGCGGADAVDERRADPPPVKRTPAPRTDPAAIAARANVPVLTYHQIRRPTEADGAQARPYIVSPEAFAEQMSALDRGGYKTVTGDALVSHVARGTPLPRKPVLLTFDDATAGQYTRALPVLRRHRYVATFFIMTVVLGKPDWLSRGQVRALDRAGMTIAGHTWDHKAVPEYSGVQWLKQLDEPKRELEKLVGHPIRLFAYPFGLTDRRAPLQLRRAGFTAAFQLADKLDRREPLFTIRRIIVPGWTGSQLLREMRRDF